MLEIKNIYLTKSNKNKSTKILKNVSLEIPQNRVTLFLGKSGSGKTSLLRCIAQLERTYLGEISYQGNSLSKFSSKKICEVIGFLPQSFPLFPHMTVLNNCAYPLRKLQKVKKNEAYGKSEEILSLLGMQKFICNHPYELSGGQQQRVAIARALALNPAFLLFDEPTSALDPENTEIFIKILKDLLQKGTGIVISSQDMHFAAKVLDNVCFLEDGQIMETYNQSQNSSPSRDSKLYQFLFSENKNEDSLLTSR